jgi:hypothetical protein
VVFAVLQRLSTEVSNKTAIAVQDSLEKILMRRLSEAEEKKWIRVSVKDAVQFMAALQGIQLSNRENLLKPKEAKAELVCNSIVSTIGIEAEKYCLEQYISNNPVAHELLDFVKKENIGHITPSLVKSDVTSLKIFSQLSSESIKVIAQDSREVSKKPLVREIADIEIAVQAAKASPFILPVSQRLAEFQDKEASFMTIVYSTFAMEQGLLKPFFGTYIMGFFTIFFPLLCALQFYQQQYIFAVVNLPRGLMAFSIMYCTHVLKSVQLGRRAMIIGFLAQAVASIVGVVIVDKIQDGAIVWAYSFVCSNDYEVSKFSTCVLYQYVYSFWQAFLWFLLAVFITWRQELAWRWWNVGCSIATILSFVYQTILGTPSFYDLGGAIAFPLLLLGTELLKFYGTLQAIRLTKRSKVVLSRVWRDIKQKDQETGTPGDKTKCVSLTTLAESVKKECKRSQHVLDRSNDLGKWKAGHVVAEPPLIHQPTSDFDELYCRALIFNDVFQKWVESFFTRKGDTSRFLYINREKTMNDRFESGIPLTFRVVEKPSSEFAVLKVDQLTDHVFFKNETILLHFQRGGPQPVGVSGAPLETCPVSIESIKVQGSTSAGIHSEIIVKCGEYSHFLGANGPSVSGMIASDFSIPTGYSEKLPFKGKVDRGPVKRPHRAIAKVRALLLLCLIITPPMHSRFTAVTVAT